MKRWSICGLAVLGVGVGAGLYFTQTGSRQPVAQPEPPVVTTTEPTTPVAPVVLANVVEVANIDPLLDPPAGELGGVPFETSPPATVPVSTPATPDRIPFAVD